MTEASPLDPRQRASFLSFWLECGVEHAYADAPIDRLTSPPPVRGRSALSSGPSLLAGPSALPVAQAPVAHSPVAPPRVAPAPDASAPVAAPVADARRAALQAQTLEALQEAIERFQGCSLRTQGATRSVFARGRPGAPVVVVGEGPGAEEDRQGLPFVGRAGQLLDRMLAAAGLEEEVFITNTVFWRPPGNRTPTPEEQAVCRPFVERAVGLVRPRLLLLLGGAATKSMLGAEEGILSLRGRWSEWSSEDQALRLPALPTLHPAFLLRQPLAKKKAWADVLRLRERLDANRSIEG